MREPCVHWSGTKALFSMVIGGTTQNDYRQVFWQIYEVSGLGAGQTVQIVRLPQPANANNVSPIYGSDDRILFTSDRPLNGNAAAVSAARRVRVDADRHRTLVDAARRHRSAAPRPRRLGRLHARWSPPTAASIFTRWDHLQRDQQNDEGTLAFGAFNYAAENQHPGARHATPRSSPSCAASRRAATRTATR